mgnify:CR=1 FL=1
MRGFKSAVKVGLLLGAPGVAGVLVVRGAGYELSWYRVEGSRASSGGGGYGLGAVVGQAEAGLLGGGPTPGLSPRPSPSPSPAVPSNRLHLPFIVR